MKKHYLMPLLFTYCKEDEKKISKFMLFRLEVIHEMLEDAHQIPADSEFDRLKGRHFLFSNTTQQEQRKTTKEMCRLSEKQNSKRILLTIAKTVKIIQDCTLDHVS